MLPIVRVQGGVYFINRTFGCSLVASAILVVKQEGGTSGSFEFDLGDDVVMIDGDSDEQ